MRAKAPTSSTFSLGDRIVIVALSAWAVIKAQSIFAFMNEATAYLPRFQRYQRPVNINALSSSSSIYFYPHTSLCALFPTIHFPAFDLPFEEIIRNLGYFNDVHNCVSYYPSSQYDHFRLRLSCSSQHIDLHNIALNSTQGFSGCRQPLRGLRESKVPLHLTGFQERGSHRSI